MSLSDLASLGSFVSGLAVLVSLVFLFFQMRQMTEQVEQTERNQRAVLNERYVSRAIDASLRTIESPHFVELCSRILAGDTAFTAEELLKLSFHFRGLLLNAQDVWLQRKFGLIDEPTFDTNMLGLKNVWLALPAYRALWLQAAPMFGPEFRTAVDAMISETPVAKPADPVTTFKANLAKVVS